MTLVQYYRLVDILAKKALKAEASRYYLGYIWWVLEPLLFVGVFYVVFEKILQTNRENFLVFLMCGKLSFIWISKSITQASNSIIANTGLIGKIDVPKSLFTMALIQEGLYKQSLVFLLLFAVLLGNGYYPGLAWLWIVPIIFVSYLMIVSCSFLGSILVCLMRDFSMLISLGMIFLLFTSGIFWDVRGLSDPGMTQLILQVNPVAFIVDAYRQVLMYGVAPNPIHLSLVGGGFGVLALLMLLILRKFSRQLALRALTA